MPQFEKILIANRGEIAVRIARSARKLGYRTVAVYSEADAEAPHVDAADEAVCIGPPPVAESYLSIDRLLDAARKTGADAVHPGYGFLSENHAFAEACLAAGLVFIGPPPEAIRLMGNKRGAKELMARASVPCLPGYSGSAQDDDTLLAEAERIGTPLMVKAAAGGGGRGMRLVTDPAKVQQAIRAARSEAERAFGSGELLLERAVLDGRHVEVQVFADEHGNVIHLGERDCSIQRRHQKVVEEAPSPAVTPHLRAHMGEAAVAAAQAIGYVGAGTVEFLLDEIGAFFFLEMNTRLQVEHPVTEMITGLDLVELQLRVAAGEPLPLRQEEVRIEGHAIEVRLYAEDATRGFLPQAGKVVAWRPATLEGVRTDAGIRSGQTVTPWYDPMLAKVIASGRSREEARRRLKAGLEETVVLGLTTNREFLRRVLDVEEFVAGKATTHFIERNFAAKEPRTPPTTEAVAIAAVLLSRHGEEERHAGTWPMPIACNGEEREVRLTLEDSRYRVASEGREHLVEVVAEDRLDLRVSVDGVLRRAVAVFEDDTLHLLFAGLGHRFQVRPRQE